jgi:hypothetical protein
MGRVLVGPWGRDVEAPTAALRLVPPERGAFLARSRSQATPLGEVDTFLHRRAGRRPRTLLGTLELDADSRTFSIEISRAGARLVSSTRIGSSRGRPPEPAVRGDLEVDLRVPAIDPRTGEIGWHLAPAFDRSRGLSALLVLDAARGERLVEYGVGGVLPPVRGGRFRPCLVSLSGG